MTPSFFCAMWNHVYIMYIYTGTDDIATTNKPQQNLMGHTILRVPCVRAMQLNGARADSLLMMLSYQYKNSFQLWR